MQLTLPREGLYNLANIVVELGNELPEFLPNTHQEERERTARLICSALEGNTNGTVTLTV